MRTTTASHGSVSGTIHSQYAHYERDPFPARAQQHQEQHPRKEPPVARLVQVTRQCKHARPLKQKLAPQARKSCNAFTGLIVSAFPLAQLVSSPIFGYMASRMGVRPVVSVTLAIMAVGYLIYALARDR